MSTHERILETAIILFNERGTAAISTNHIAEETGISPGNLYYHFTNKAHIIRAINEQMLAAWDATYQTSLTTGDLTTQLRAFLTQNFKLMWHYRFFFRELVALLRGDTELHTHYKTTQQVRFAHHRLLIHYATESGILELPDDPAVAEALITNAWLISDFWVLYCESVGTEIDEAALRQGVEHVLALFQPYISEAAS